MAMPLREIEGALYNQVIPPAQGRIVNLFALARIAVGRPSDLG